MAEEATQEGASIHERIMAQMEAPEPEQEAPEAPEEPEEELPAEDADEPEEQDEPQEEDEEEVASEDAQEAEEAHVELSEVAEYLGIDDSLLDVNDEGKVVLKTKVDGEEGTANLADLLKSYQLEGHLNKKNMEVSELQKSLQQKQAELEQTFGQRLQTLEDSISIAQQELLSDYQSVNWEQLRAEDPAEYAAKTADFQRRQDRLQAQYTRLHQERQQQQQTSQQMTAQQLQEEQQKLLQAIPEWKDESTAKKEQAQLRDYGVSIGFQPQDLAEVADHRAVNILRKAMLYDQLQAEKPKVSKKLKKAAPKVAKPGQPKSKEASKATQTRKLKSAVKGGQRGSVAQYLLSTGKA